MLRHPAPTPDQRVRDLTQEGVWRETRNFRSAVKLDWWVWAAGFDPCQSCPAGPGQPCRAKRALGDKAPLIWPHAERVNLDRLLAGVRLDGAAGRGVHAVPPSEALLALGDPLG